MGQTENQQQYVINHIINHSKYKRSKNCNQKTEVKKKKRQKSDLIKKKNPTLYHL